MSRTYCISSNFSVYPDATQVITRKEWQEFVSNHDRNVFCQGRLRTLKVRSIGAGMLEVYSTKFKP